MIIHFQLYHPRIFFASIRFVGNSIPLAQAVPFISKNTKRGYTSTEKIVLQVPHFSTMSENV